MRIPRGLSRFLVLEYRWYNPLTWRVKRLVTWWNSTSGITLCCMTKMKVLNQLTFELIKNEIILSEWEFTKVNSSISVQRSETDNIRQIFSCWPWRNKLPCCEDHVTGNVQQALYAHNEPGCQPPKKLGLHLSPQGTELEEGPELQIRFQSQLVHLFQSLRRKTQVTYGGFLAYRNSEITHFYCFKLPSIVGWIVATKRNVYRNLNMWSHLETGFYRCN